MNNKEMKWFGIKAKPMNLACEEYGRVINLSVGLLIGLAIDKSLLYVSKGLSVFIPPFAIMLMSKGKILHTIRFDKTFSKPVEKLLSHFIRK